MAAKISGGAKHRGLGMVEAPVELTGVEVRAPIRRGGCACSLTPFLNQ